MRKLVVFFVLLILLFTAPLRALAAEDPLATSNNKFGVHILFPSELPQAAKLVNSSGGDWGYVTIPIQSGDKDLAKWQYFMDQCRQYHVIPIIRLATEGDYFNTSVWRKPNFLDVLDFANFLNSLNWPTKNRYIIVFNEPNHGNEWGGFPNPAEYADVLSFAVTIFKSRSDDFFIISAGLDNASANSATTMNEYRFLTLMNQEVPGIFEQVDGFGSHSYPNPAFSEPPWYTTNESVATFRYETSLLSRLGNKTLPVFITETGWSRNMLSEDTIASYFNQAFTNVWSDQNVAAVTPFLLEAGADPFAQFSILTGTGQDTKLSLSLKAIPKVKGTPTLNQTVLAAETTDDLSSLPTKKFPQPTKPSKTLAFDFTASLKVLAKYLLHI